MKLTSAHTHLHAHSHTHTHTNTHTPIQTHSLWRVYFSFQLSVELFVRCLSPLKKVVLSVLSHIDFVIFTTLCDCSHTLAAKKRAWLEALGCNALRRSFACPCPDPQANGRALWILEMAGP